MSKITCNLLYFTVLPFYLIFSDYLNTTEYDVSICDSTGFQCLNGGSEWNCSVCACIHGYSGRRCEVPPDGSTCDSTGFQCLNGGSCWTLNGKSVCACIYGYSGRRCEVPPGLNISSMKRDS